MKTRKPNPRFVWNIGAISEEYPDMPEQQDDSLRLWDRQEQKYVAVIHADYAQAICLELNNKPENMPLTLLETWLNRLSNRALTSEGIKPTNTRKYRA